MMLFILGVVAGVASAPAGEAALGLEEGLLSGFGEEHPERATGNTHTERDNIATEKRNFFRSIVRVFSLEKRVVSSLKREGGEES